MRDKVWGHCKGKITHKSREIFITHMIAVTKRAMMFKNVKVQIVERNSVPAEEAVRIFLEFKRVESAIKGTMIDVFFVNLFK